MQPLLTIKNLTKRFGGLFAVKNVSLEVKKGETVAIIGPNGAGKTTLINLISGFIKPDRGKIFFEGKDITNIAQFKRAKLGIGRTFQVPQPFKDLTVLENCMAAALFAGKAKKKELSKDHVLDILKLVGLYEKKDEPARKLGVIDAKRLELARCLSQDPKLVLLDECGAGLSSFEIEEFIDILKAISENGITILMIEHIMSIVEEAAQRVYCMVAGEIIAEGPLKKILCDEKVIKSYLG